VDQFQSEQINELAAAIVKAQLALVPAVKDHVNPFFKSKYADLPSVWEAAASFRENGIAITQSPMDAPDEYIVLDTQLTHLSGQWMRSRLKIRVAKNDPQGYGSALTYARRYALGCMTGIVTEEDDDGNAASHQPKAQAYTASKQTAQAKIAELRVEGPARQDGGQNGGPTDGQGTGSPLSTQQGPDAAAPFIFAFGRCNGQAVETVADSQLSWYMQYYTNKLHAEPASRYANEWQEACLAIEQENVRRANDPTR